MGVRKSLFLIAGVHQLREAAALGKLRHQEAVSEGRPRRLITLENRKKHSSRCRGASIKALAVASTQLVFRTSPL